ncbi:MAG: hypothetical protein ACK5N8_07090 [Alphaproteobacteria bacterium]
MIKSTFLNIGIIAFIVIAYYFNLFDFLTEGYFIWTLIIVILIIFGFGIKYLGNPFTKKDSEK